MSLTDADAALRAIFRKIHEDRNKEIVYKQDVIDTIITWVVEEKPDMKIPIDLIGRIHDLPPQKGRWIRNDNGTYSCSVCQSWIPEEQCHYARYCLYCGAEMRENDNEK